MNKLFFVVVVSIGLIGCKSTYCKDRNSHITLTEQKYLVNDSLSLSLELPYYYDDNTALHQPGIDQKIHLVLAPSKVDKKNDLILYSDGHNIVLLRNRVDDLAAFREISINDSTLNKFYTSSNKGESFYRKTEIDKKRKLITINDVFLFGNKYIQYIEYLQSDLAGGTVTIDPSNPDDILFFAGVYQELLNLSKRNAKNIYERKL